MHEGVILFRVLVICSVIDKCLINEDSIQPINGICYQKRALQLANALKTAQAQAIAMKVRLLVGTKDVYVNALDVCRNVT